LRSGRIFDTNEPAAAVEALDLAVAPKRKSKIRLTGRPIQTKAGVPRGNRFFRTARRESKDSFELSCVIEQPELLAQDIREFFRPLRNAA
jgi:hypothetical protein